MTSTTWYTTKRGRPPPLPLGRTVGFKSKKRPWHTTAGKVTSTAWHTTNLLPLGGGLARMSFFLGAEKHQKQTPNLSSRMGVCCWAGEAGKSSTDQAQPITGTKPGPQIHTNLIGGGGGGGTRARTRTEIQMGIQ